MSSAAPEIMEQNMCMLESAAVLCCLLVMGQICTCTIQTARSCAAFWSWDKTQNTCMVILGRVHGTDHALSNASFWLWDRTHAWLAQNEHMM
eukprot:1159086-Pelagomonas_calceolata.AAC.12